MSFRTKAEAMLAARKLLARMNSPGWKIDVWSNLGWHFCLKRGTMSLRQDGNTYNVYYSDEEGGVGEPTYYNICGHRSNDPNVAVAGAINRAEKFIRRLILILNKNRTAHGLPPLVLRAVLRDRKVARR